MSSSANGLSLVDTRQLATFAAVAHERSFSVVAEQLGYTRSAVSQQIAALERTLGVPLLERRRGARPLGPTEAGALLLRHADRILAGLRAVEADFAALAAGSAGRVRVGAFQTVGMSVLPPLLARFGERHPAVEVDVEEALTVAHLLGRVEEGALDLTFCELPVQREPLDAVELMRDPFVLLVRAQDPLGAGGTGPSAAELEDLPLVGYKSPSSADVVLEAAGLTPRVAHRSNETATLHGLVAAGVGVGLLPSLAVDPRDDRVRAIAPPPEIAPRTLGLAWHRDRWRSAASRAFAELAVALCAELDGGSAERVADSAAAP